MSVAGNEITAGQTYTVRLDQRNSLKRRNDALALVKRIGAREDHSASYDGRTRTWTVVLPADSFYGLDDLRTLARAYDAEVTAAGQETAPARTAARRPANAEWTEYSSGFGPDELAAMSAQTRRAVTGS